MSKKNMTPPPAELRNVLSYDPKSGHFTWLISFPKLKADRRAGAISHISGGYRRIGYKGRYYLEHCLAWWWVYGVWTEQEIDHRNLDKTDNRIENLRLATPAQNQANKRGFGKWPKGVAKLKRGRFMAQIRVNRKKVYLGCFATPEEAHAAYMAKARELHGDFARPA